MSLRKYSVKFALVGALAALAAVAAPSAFARGHVNVGVSIGVPGFGIGYSDCRHCGYRGGYGYGYVGAYAPVYYGPGYYEPAYYGPAYYPAYSSVYISDRSYRYGAGHYHGGYRHDYGHRGSYYNRGGYHH